MGFSMGGMVALHMTLLEPRSVAGLVLVDSNARPDLLERDAMRRDQQRRVRDGELDQVVRHEMAPHYFAPDHPDRDALAERAVLMAMTLGDDVFIRQSEAIRTRPDSRAELGRIGCPTLVVGGEQDVLCRPDWQHELVAGIAGAELAIIPGSGHFVPIEAADRFVATMMDWGARHCLI